MRGGNVQNGEIIEFDDDVNVNDSRYIETCTVRKGDILLVASTGSSELIGKTGYARKDYRYTQIGAFLRIIRPIAAKTSDYLNLIFQSESYKSHIREKAKGTNINNVKASYILDYEILLPPLKEQQLIVESANRYFCTINGIQKEL